jgi:hypothetical protein
MARNINHILKHHDVDTIYPERLRATLAAMAKEDPKALDYENELFKRAKVQAAYAVKFRKMFAAHLAKVPGEIGSGRPDRVVWCALPRVAKQLRDKFKLGSGAEETK